jgi:ribosome-associated protein
MDDMFQGDNKAAAIALSRLIEEHRGGEVIALDLRELNSWTDFFVIATVTSTTHLQGLLRQVKEFAGEAGLEILRKHRKVSPDDGWNLVDMGAIVVHLMTAPCRSFYELEQLWGSAGVLYSSKSS